MPWDSWRQKGSTYLSNLCHLQIPVRPTALPSLDDSDDIIHLDVQLIRLLEVLKGPHVSRLSLGAKRGHCPTQDLAAH